MTDRQQQDPDECRVVREGLLSVHTLDGDRCVVSPSGELDRSTVELLEQELAKAEASGASEIVLDLSKLTFMDSGGLKLVLEAEVRSRGDSNRRLSLVRGPPRVQRVFELAGLESRLPFID